MDGIVHILWIMMVTRERLSENRVFDRTRPEYKESAKIALSEGLITDFSDSLGGDLTSRHQTTGRVRVFARANTWRTQRPRGASGFGTESQ